MMVGVVGRLVILKRICEAKKQQFPQYIDELPSSSIVEKQINTSLKITRENFMLTVFLVGRWPVFDWA